MNASDLALTNAALWSIGEGESPELGSTVDEVKARILGLSACSTIELPLAELSRAAELQLQPDVQQADPALLRSVPIAVQEVYATLQAPSGYWYTVGQGGFLESVMALTPNGMVHVGGEVRDPEQAIALTPANYGLGDTVAEGADEPRNYVTQVQGPSPVARAYSGAAVGTFLPNGCASAAT